MDIQEIRDVYFSPMLDLIYRAATVHRAHHQSREVQICSLLSVKTGACPEDCAYCPQSARYKTGIEKHALLSVEEVVASAQKAKAAGSTRFCMGAAWREVKDNKDFDAVLEMVREVGKLNMEVCTTLGMLTATQAQKLKEAGLTAYNHNVDTSEEHYGEIIHTRTYADRKQTLENVARANISVCCGGIIGLGETDEDRIAMIHFLSTLETPPESVPVNALVPVKGTPLENQKRVSVWEMIRMIATVRVIFPHAMVRLSAGRLEMSTVEQALCFLAGANSIFSGDKLLTTPNPAFHNDMEMFELLGLKPLEPHAHASRNRQFSQETPAHA